MPQLVPDHAYIWVSRGAPEAEVLVELGIRQWPETANTGEGVTWTGFQFENFFLELNWVTDERRFQEAWVSWHEAHAERSDWKATGAAPFALAFHRQDPANDAVPKAFQVENWWDRQGGYVPGLDGRFPFLMLMSPRHSMPNPAWMTPAIRALADNPAGISKLTAWTLHTPQALEHEVLDTLVAQGALQIEDSSEYLLELTFDAARQQKTFDARPALPLIINY